MNYYTADPHFFHKNICGKDAFVEGRKMFLDEIEMNETIIENWNKVVKSTDTVYIIGDVAMHGKPKAVFELLKRLNGTIIIVKGNHDSTKFLKYLLNNNYTYAGRDKFEIHDVGLIKKIDGLILYLTHYPLMIGDRKKMVSVHGHVHDMPLQENFFVNVGVDSPDFVGALPFGQPIPELDLMNKIREKKATKNVNVLEWRKGED